MRQQIRVIHRFFLSALLLMVCGGRPAAATPTPGGFVALVQVAQNLSDPIGVTHAGDGSNRLFIVERAGTVRIFDGTQVLATPFLDITALVTCGSSCGERGLLGLAFHPDYETNGFFYVDYTRADGDIVIARYQVSAGNPNVANPAGTVLLTIEHSSQGNHNGGQLAFGPDGYLYISVGDGGGGGDFLESGQSINTLLGKILRIDVNSGSPYGIPPTNPFAGPTAGLDEIWAYGLRNPWRFSFDRGTGDLYIGDVGQGTWEEIDFQAAGSAGGQNYGWDCREGKHNYNDTDDLVNMPPIFNADCPGRTFVEPVLEYNHSTGGCSVTGGHVYRGGVQSFLTGSYLYSDFCNGTILRGFRDGGGNWTSQALSVPVLSGLSSFGEGETGRIYITYLPVNFGTNVPNSLYWLSPYTFQDVPPNAFAWSAVEALLTAGITTGCDPATPRFCPAGLLSRAEMAVFLVRGIHGGSFVPPAPSGDFADVPPGYWAAAWIEQLHDDGITQGCAASPLRFCPEQSLSRAEMAVFLLRARHGGGYTPPPATGTVFADVPASYWAAAWIEQLYDEGLTTGCASSPLRYCPDGTVTRAELAAFLARTFELPLP